MAQKKEIILIDLLRFFCASSVMFSHLLVSVSYDYSWAKYGVSGVEVFFVISGFVIPYSAEGKSPFSFLKNRVVRLVPGVWICATLSALAIISLPSADLTSFTLLGRYLRTILFVPFWPGYIHSLDDMWVAGVYWTLFVEIAFYAVVYLLLLKNAFKFLPALATGLGCITLSYWLLYFYTQAYFSESKAGAAFIKTDFARYLDLGLVHQGALFGLGINLWLLSKGRFSGRILSTVICYLGGAMELIHLATKFTHLCVFWHLVFYTMGITVIIISIIATQNAVPPNLSVVRFAKAIGLTTYPLYLLHVPLGHTLIFILYGTGLSFLNATIIGIILVLATAVFVALYIEPYLQKIFRAILMQVGPP